MGIISLAREPERTAVASFMTGVYVWMAVGLAITASVAYATADSTSFIRSLDSQPALLIGIFLAQLAVVFVLSARVDRLSAGVAGLLFLIYSALTGVTFSELLLIYTSSSLGATFAIAGGMFAAMAIYGAVTKSDLSMVGRFFIMTLIGLILASVVGLFWRSSILQIGISVVGVLVFSGLTAWDTQRLEHMALSGGPETGRGGYAVAGALALYLDLINLFLSLLQLFGRRRD